MHFEKRVHIFLAAYLWREVPWNKFETNNIVQHPMSWVGLYPQIRVWFIYLKNLQAYMYEYTFTLVQHDKTILSISVYMSLVQISLTKLWNRRKKCFIIYMYLNTGKINMHDCPCWKFLYILYKDKNLSLTILIRYLQVTIGTIIIQYMIHTVYMYLCF